MKRDHESALAGVLLGTAVGDSLGLPMEGISARRARRLFPGPLRQRLVGPWGMVSDDTEHTFMAGQALLRHPDDVMEFQRALAWGLRWWLLAVPAGVGLATLRSIVRLWLGFSPGRSGIFSAGNGPAMRSALLGVMAAEDAERRRALVHASTVLTHRDPRAEIAAAAVAEMAAWMAGEGSDRHDLLSRLRGLAELPEWAALTGKLEAGWRDGWTTGDFAQAIGAGGGVTGYAFRSVPVAVYAAGRHPTDFTRALEEVIGCGGDTDTTGAIAGALVGARVGVEGIPAEWVQGIREWPRSVGRLRNEAERLAALAATGHSPGPTPWCWPAAVVRNAVFTAIVIAHALRRLFPPW